MATASIFQNYVHLVEHKALIIITKQIQEGNYKEQVEAIRKLIAEGQEKEADKLKKQLPAFTPSGTFESGRKAELLTQYSGFVILDLDKLSPEDLERAKSLVALAPYTFAAFISPSGNGLKIIVPVNSTAEHHKLAFQQVSDYYEQALQLVVDLSGKDVSRLCFMSYDPDSYRNINAEPFNVNIETAAQEPPKKEKPKAEQEPIKHTEGSSDETDWLEVFGKCVDFTDRKANYTEGNRNNYVHLLACNCNRAGIPENIALGYILQHFDLDTEEATPTIHSAYANNVADFAKFANNAKFTNTSNFDYSNNQTEDYLKRTPTIPEEAINLMPELFREGARAFDSDPRKRDVFLTSAFCIISGCLPDVQGVYHQERVYPHLFSFIIAPAASGKGVLKNAKRLGDKIHERVKESSKKARELYEIEIAEYKAQLHSRKKSDPNPEKPNEPASKLLFIPADCSQAMMMQILQDNDGRGIICETEADAMSGANKQDWGNYSHIMRAAFHHEKISAARKTNRELIEIKNPQLAVALSGTPSQVPKLIASAEDGLFSRFLFYAFKNDLVWLDPSPQPGSIVYNDHFEALSNTVIEMNDFLSQCHTEVYLTSTQWQKLNTAFKDKLMNVVVFTSEEAASVVYRLGLILYRFCMIFTALRKFENGDCSSQVYCSDSDFEAAMILSDVYLEHSLLMFNNLPKQNETIQFLSGDAKRCFFKALHHEFTRKEAIEIGTKFKLSARTVDDVLKSATGVSLVRIKAGHYQRI